MFRIFKFDTVDSTNEIAKSYSPGSVIVAHCQTEGKGRFERKWKSPLGGLWFSIVIRPEKEAYLYNFAAGLAVLESLEEMNIAAGLKWPNDVYAKDRKICGILSKAIGHSRLIIGIGINVNNKINKAERKAISIIEIKGEKVDSEQLLLTILSKFEQIIKNDKDLIKRYKEKCYLLGKKIRIRTQQGVISGLAKDIDEYGRLIVEENGKIIIVDEGDATTSKQP